MSRFLPILLLMLAFSCDSSPEDIKAKMLSYIVVSTAWEPAALFTSENPDCVAWAWDDISQYETLVDFIGTHVACLYEPAGEDHWQYPDETWNLGTADCEDFTFLYCALLRYLGYTGRLWAVYGHFMNSLHVWTEVYPYADDEDHGYLLDGPNPVELNPALGITREMFGRELELIAEVP